MSNSTWFSSKLFTPPANWDGSLEHGTAEVLCWWCRQCLKRHIWEPDSLPRTKHLLILIYAQQSLTSNVTLLSFLRRVMVASSTLVVFLRRRAPRFVVLRSWPRTSHRPPPRRWPTPAGLASAATSAFLPLAVSRQRHAIRWFRTSRRAFITVISVEHSYSLSTVKAVREPAVSVSLLLIRATDVLYVDRIIGQCSPVLLEH